MTLAYLAGVLGRAGHALRVHECIASGITTETLFSEMDRFNPELALINTTTPSINSDMTFVQRFKERYPDCCTTVFGTHVTALHDSIMAGNPPVDCVIRNEPEWSAVELAAELQSEGGIAHSIPGCTVRIDGEIIAFEDREYNPDLDSLGFPAWEYFDQGRYIHPIFNRPYVMVNTSRGCIHNCVFCVAHVFYGKKVRFRSVRSIVDELEHHVIGKYGIRHVWMYADDFTRSPDFVKELCRAIIARRIKITWWTNTRVDKPDEEMFRLMKEAGCFMLSIGGESGSAGILRNVKKGTRPEQIEQTVGILRKVGINSLLYFLIGLPGETRETIRETLDFAKKCNPDYVEFYPATPYPGTDFFETARAENLIVERNWDKYLCGGTEFVIDIPGVDKAELDHILKRAYREFYFRPAYVGILFRRAVRPAEFARLILFGARYVRRFFGTAS
jgi:radical SAM superfamily enzyme YgiQ (UPF0313 family)